MKKLFLIFSLLFVLISCDNQSDEANYYSVILPVYEADLPQEFVMGETYYLKIRYKQLSTCHSFTGFYYDKYLNERTIAVQNIVTEASNCFPINDNIVEATLKFYVTNNGSYVFKFWQGVDDNGEDIFLEIEVPVVD